MKKIELRGEEYNQFAKIVFLNNRRQGNLAELTNWEQPLNFKENTYILRQQAGGPCGFFAALNSHMVLKRSKPENATKTPEQLLNSIILEIFKRVSTYSNTETPQYKPIYVFCDCLIPENNFIHFKYTESPEEAYNFLIRTRYLHAYNACLMLALSYIFASLGMKEFRNISEYQYIYPDKMTAMALVYLLLNGSVTPISTIEITSTNDADFDGFDQKEIGIKVLDNPDERVNNAWLNRSAKLYVCLKYLHFFVIQYNDGEKVTVFDSLNSWPPYEVDRKLLNC